ncbi:hypothetical protein OLEAN_C23720 [Oleispira antarctica RB-8]|uniref:C-type lectin domain-containing protein n=1 Tax=Oleispira antarctica RB-8 TaxID=698738 RepID=R4YT00_OLEAN|nr:hypothetical protein OLEAN_C23720 [Oleispira antarctica RB-8]
MQILLAKKHMLLSFTLGAITIFFTSLAFSYDPGLTYKLSRDDLGTTGVNESEQGCVYRESDASTGAWTVDDCDYVGAHYACYNGSEWQVAQALGTTTKPGEPLDGNAASKTKSVNSWDPIKADSLCKNNFGPAYFFSVPVNDGEDTNLGRAIAGITAAKKRTWVYYYSNINNFSLSENYWLGNRTEYTNWFGGNLGNTSDSGGVADCTLIHRDTGLWQDVSCSEKHSFACYDTGAWFITEEQDEWRSGFAVCDEQQGLQALYAVPRDSIENDGIKAATLPVGGTGISADYNKVWLNRTDLAFEEFFISNQTRQAWWGEGQPTNRNNADCALINSSGQWIAESCNGYVAYHACYLGNNSSGDAQWELTDKKAESALGFGYCKKLADSAEYRPPNSAVSNSALSAMVDALPDNKFVWINYSDQVSEGFWTASSQFQDFVTSNNVVEGDAEDCGYFNLNTDSKKNWVAGQCYAGGASLQQGFACTNGYEWKVATNALVGAASLTSDLWKDGFAACEDAFGKDYQFAAPHDADQNSRLSLALRLSGNTQAWMNLNDAKTEGEWVSNGPIVNLSPVIELSLGREFPEKQSFDLSVTAIDPETGNNIGLIYQWTIIDQRVGANNTGTDTVITPILIDANTPTVTIPEVDLVNDDYYLDIQLQVTDADVDSPATTTTILTIKIISPLRAAYDFNQYTNPSLDASGNGHSLILNTSQVEITPRKNDSNDYFAKLGDADSFSIDGSNTGLQVGTTQDQYTLIYRFRLDSLPVSDWAGFIQKGNAGNRQPGLFFNKSTKKIQFNNTTSDVSTGPHEQELSLETVRVGQWMTIAYVKNGSNTKLYIDKAEIDTSYPDPSPLNVIPDSAKVLLGASTGYASGDWVFGNVPDASEGIIGGFDDIRIYDRALTAVELSKVFPDQPRGEFQFANEQEIGDENEIENDVNELLIPVSRLLGDDGIVSVAFKIQSDSATLDVDFRLKDDPKPLGDPDRGQGILTWSVHDREDKNIIVELIGDSLREGTETFTIELEGLGSTEPGLGNNSLIDVNIVDKTPNPYGAIAIAPSTASDNIAVNEGGSGVITVERVGTDSLGAFDVVYEIQAVTAINPDDFSITQSGFPISGTPNGNVLGQGRLSFTDNSSGTPEARQTKTIDFTTILDNVFETDEIFAVNLIKVTDPGSATLSVPSTSAILGTNKSYFQTINDITPGRISFKQVSYSADEVDQGNVVLVTLERLDGNDGEMCVTLGLTGDAGLSDDYSISYLNSSASGQSDIYWEDQDAAEKSVQITIADDQRYDPNETIVLTWVNKANCNGISTTTPDVAEAGDHGSTTITITDHTTPIKLKFTEANYTVSELIPTKTITIQATQSRLLSDDAEADFDNSINNNTFEVFLKRSFVSAAEGVHYGDLTPQQVISFGPGETEKTITVPIVDNCDGSASLSFGIGLVNNDASLSNTLPVGLIDASSATSALTITNGSSPIGFTGLTKDYTGIPSRINPTWKNDGRFYVTGQVNAADLNPELTEMRMKAGVTHNCFNDLVFDWSLSVSASGPQLPSGNGLSSTFSVLPTVAATSTDKTLLEKFQLPFVIKDTNLIASLTITDPETGVIYDKNSGGLFSQLEHPFTVSQNFRTIENNNEGGNNCVDWEGVDARVKNKTCNTIDRQNGIAYNPTTEQLVFGEESNGLSCISHTGGDAWLFAKYCGSDIALGQRWSVTGDKVNSLDRPGIFFIESAITSGYEPYASDSGRTAGARRWTWLNLSGTYLP